MKRRQHTVVRPNSVLLHCVSTEVSISTKPHLRICQQVTGFLRGGKCRPCACAERANLLRYRPDMWSHAVSRSSLQDRPVDDQALSLIQAFLNVAQTLIPSLIVKVLNPHEDRDA
jgi:hypothetical protein